MAAPKPPAGLPASSWLLVDAGSGEALASQDAERALPVASATKLMTAYVTLRELNPDDEVTAPAYEAGPAESLMGLEAGETVSVRDLLYGLLVPSGNDAAVALALRVAGSVPDFVATMNETATRLGLRDTVYADPIGLDSANSSSAHDLVRLTRRLRRDGLFRRIVDTERITVGSGKDRHRLVNRNTLLLEEPFVDGVKTGTTLAAGYILVASAERRGVELVSAVLGAPGEASRDEATLELLDYGFSLYRKRALVRPGDPVARVPLAGDRGALPLVTGGSVRAVARSDQEVELEFSPPAPPEGAVERGEPFGSARVTLDGIEVGSVPVVAARAVAPPADAEEGLPRWALLVFAGAGILAAGLAWKAIAVARRDPR